MAWTLVLRSIGPATQAAALAVFCALATSASAYAQAASTVTPTPNATAQPAAKSPGPAHPAKRKLHSHTAKAEAPPVVAVAPHPPAPPPPDWPVNDKAVPASVAWNGSALSIAATNSSLQQILLDVSTATGVKVEGLGSDQRIYGSYGPATARDVLNQLLDGSGYNVLMIGDKGEGTPRELVLTAKVSHAGPQGKAGNAQSKQSSDDDTAEEPEPPEPDPNLHRPPAGPQPGQVRTPQQILQDREQQQQSQPQTQQPQTQPQTQPQSQQGFPPPPQQGFPPPPK